MMTVLFLVHVLCFVVRSHYFMKPKLGYLKAFLDKIVIGFSIAMIILNNQRLILWRIPNSLFIKGKNKQNKFYTVRLFVDDEVWFEEFAPLEITLPNVNDVEERLFSYKFRASSVSFAPFFVLASIFLTDSPLFIRSHFGFRAWSTSFGFSALLTRCIRSVFSFLTILEIFSLPRLNEHPSALESAVVISDFSTQFHFLGWIITSLSSSSNTWKNWGGFSSSALVEFDWLSSASE